MSLAPFWMLNNEFTVFIYCLFEWSVIYLASRCPLRSLVLFRRKTARYMGFYRLPATFFVTFMSLPYPGGCDAYKWKALSFFSSVNAVIAVSMIYLKFSHMSPIEWTSIRSQIQICVVKSIFYILHQKLIITTKPSMAWIIGSQFSLNASSLDLFIEWNHLKNILKNKRFTIKHIAHHCFLIVSVRY